MSNPSDEQDQRTDAERYAGDLEQRVRDLRESLAAEKARRAVVELRAARLEAALRDVLPMAQDWAYGKDSGHPDHQRVSHATATLLDKEEAAPW